MLVDSAKEVQSAPEIEDAELARLGGWQQQEVKNAKQPSAPDTSQPLPLLDEDDTVTPEEIKQERPWWMKGTWRMLIAGGATLGVLHVMFSLLGLWGTSKQAPPSIVSTDPMAINQEVTAKMEQLQAENENLKKEQVMGEPLPQQSSQKTPQAVKVPAQPQKVTYTSVTPRRVVVTQSPIPPRPMAYPPPPSRRIAYAPPPPRILPRPVVASPSRLAPPTPKETLDPTAQWLAAANIGSYGNSSPATNSQATSAQSNGDDNYQTANYQNNQDSAWAVSGGTGAAPQEVKSDRNNAESRNPKFVDNSTNNSDSQSETDARTVTYSNSVNSLIVGTKANGKLATPIAWSGALENPSQNFLIQLSEPLMAANNTVAVPKGAYLVAKVITATEAGLLQMSVNSMLVNSNGQTIEKPLPEGALMVLGKGGRPLKASAERPDSTGTDLGTVVLQGLATTAGLANRPSSQSTYSSDGYSSTVTNGDRNYLAGFGEGAAQALVQQAQNRNRRALRSRESEPTVFMLNQGASVQIFVNQSVSLANP